MNRTARLIALPGILLSLSLAGCDSQSPSLPHEVSAVTATMHVSSMSAGWRPCNGAATKGGHAYVTIQDQSGLPVAGATVSGTWSGCTRGDDSAVTVNGGSYPNGTPLPDGTADITSSKCRSCPKQNCKFTFTVTDVTHPSYTYDPTQNVRTSSYSCCDPFKSC